MDMARDDLLRILAEALAVVVERPVTALTLDMSLTEDFGLESIEILDFFVEVEARLQHQVDLVDLLRSRSSTTNFNRNLSIKEIVEFLEKESTQ